MRSLLSKCYFVLIIYVIISGCNSKPKLNPKEYLHYYASKKEIFKNDFKLGDHAFEVIYQPSDIFVAEKLVSSTLDSDSITAQFKGIEYFLLNISTTNSDTVNIRTKEYVQFEMENDLSLTINDKIFQPFMYQFENIGLESNIFRVFVGFETNDLKISDGKCVLKIKENYFHNTELPISLDFTNFPDLKFN